MRRKRTRLLHSVLHRGHCRPLEYVRTKILAKQKLSLLVRCSCSQLVHNFFCSHMTFYLPSFNRDDTKSKKISSIFHLLLPWLSVVSLRSVKMTDFLFNIDGGYLEGLCRGFKCGILKQSDYLNLVQCETLEGSYKFNQFSLRFSLWQRKRKEFSEGVQCISFSNRGFFVIFDRNCLSQSEYIYDNCVQKV